MDSFDFKRLNVAGGILEYATVGVGEPVVLIHGACIAEAYAPLCLESALAEQYQLVRYHRRGYAGSSAVAASFSIRDQASDCVELMRGLGIERAHVVGHSSGGPIALQLAQDAPEMVQSLVLLEPGLLDVPSGPLLIEKLGPALQCYAAGNKADAVDAFLRAVIGSDYRGFLDALIPDAFAQAVTDADTVFGPELAALRMDARQRLDNGRDLARSEIVPRIAAAARKHIHQRGHIVHQQGPTVTVRGPGHCRRSHFRRQPIENAMFPQKPFAAVAVR